jgi:hypothetical protein
MRWRDIEESELGEEMRLIRAAITRVPASNSRVRPDPTVGPICDHCKLFFFFFF